MKVKKLFITLLACFTVFALCMPSFAENEIDISNYARSTELYTEEQNNVTSQNNLASGEDQIMPISEDEQITNTSIDTTATYYVNSDMYFADDTVTVDMPINGNVFVFGSDVTVSNTISGDLFIFGDNVDISSTAEIYGSIFVFANTFTFNGHAYDIYAAANEIVLGSTSYLYRDLKSYSSSLSLDGMITRNVYSSAENISISSNTKIGRDLSYTSKNEVNVPEGVVTGEVNFHVMKKLENTKTFGDYASSIVSQAIFVFAIFLVCLGIAPKFGKKAALVLQKKWGASIGLGLAGVVGIPLFAFLLLTTGIATSLSIYTFILYGLLLATGFTIVCIAINQIIATKFNFTKKWMPLASILLVAIVLGILKLIPFVGFALTTFGLGIFIVSLFYHPEKEEA